MKKTKNISKNSVVLLIAIMLLTVPNLQIYSSVGNYESQSSALYANEAYNARSIASEEAFLPAALAVAAGVGLAVVAVVGAVDGWNSHHSELASTALNFDDNYSKHDFSKFDN